MGDFTLVEATRKDAGKYTLRINNPSGKDSETVELTVLGKPSSPKGPLEVTDVHKEGCKLSWTKPDDDGGLPIKEYEIEKWTLPLASGCVLAKSTASDSRLPTTSLGWNP